MRVVGKVLVMVLACALALGFMLSVPALAWAVLLGARWALVLLVAEALMLAYLIYYWIRNY